jgi:short-subunit dehydrogenase
MKKHKLVWITGASSGIGYALSLEMAALGHQLIISGRNLEMLNNLAEKTKAFVLPFDATSKAESMNAGKIIEKKFGYIDTIILNAGTCEYLEPGHFNSEIFERMMQTNFISMVYGIEAALPLLKKSKMPHIVGMSSAVAYIGLSRSEAYGASKAAILNFLEGLRVSLIAEKILVSIVLPGFIKTPLTDKNDFPMPMLMDVTSAAKRIAKKIEKKKFTIEVPWFFVFIIRIISFLPQKARFYILKKLRK